MKETLRKIPQISLLLNDEAILLKSASFSFEERKTIVRNTIQEIKEEILKGLLTDITYESVVNRVLNNFTSTYSLKPVVNGTGTILHTNLGRAIMSENVINHMSEIARNYSNLEVELPNQKRSSRLNHLKSAFCEYLGVEDYLIVNNNAASLLLVGDTLAKNKEIIISRSEMVEIGDSFRVHEILSTTSILNEVGSTNRTHLKDYIKEVSTNTGLIIKVNKANYEMTGYVKDVSIKELKSNVELPVIYDYGSGLIDEYPFSKKNVKTYISEGADLVLVSADKLLAGPQAGIIFGKTRLINKLKENPMYRALRVDKLTLAGLEAVIKEYLLTKSNPVLNMINIKSSDLKSRAQDIVEATNTRLIEVESTIGGGTTPNSKLISYGLEVVTNNPQKKQLELSSLELPIITRINDNRLIIDLRTVIPIYDEYLKEVL